MNDILKMADPDNLLNYIRQLESRLEAVERGFVSANAADELVIDMGRLESGDFGGATLDGDGLHANADQVDINWWLPLNLATDTVTSIHALKYDGSEYVYVGGSFTTIGGIAAKRIARYSLTTRNWEEVGGGVNNIVRAICISTGGDVYIGGDFAGDGPSRFAKLNTTTGIWNALGPAFLGNVYAIAIDAAGDIYAGGDFTGLAGPIAANRIAKYSFGSASWAQVAGGVNGTVRVIGISPGGDVYIGGNFSNAGGDADADGFAKLQSGAWVSVGGGHGTGSDVRSIAFDSLGYLYTGGAFTNVGGDELADNIVRLESGVWVGVGGGLNGIVHTIAIDDSDTVYVGGEFTNAGEDPDANNVARLVDGNWASISNGGNISGLDGYPYIILPLASGSMIVGGSFEFIGAIQCQGIALYCKLLSEAIDTIASLFELYALRDDQPNTRVYVVETDCYSTTVAPWENAAVNGGGLTELAGEANHPGILRLNSLSTVDGGGANSGRSVNLGHTASLLFGGGEEFDAVFRLMQSANFLCKFGFMDTFASAAPVDGAWINISGATLSGKTRNNSTESTTSTTYTVATNNWYRIRVALNSNATLVTFSLYSDGGVLLWRDTLASNIPTAAGRETSCGGVAIRTTDTTSQLVELDWMRMSIDRVLVR